MTHDSVTRSSWVRAAVLAGIAYLLVGRVFAWPSENVRFWRWAFWFASAGIFAIHIRHELRRGQHVPVSVALRAAAAVAIGAFGLAVVGAVNSWLTTSTLRPLWLLAFVLWPAATAVPAFIVALIAAWALTRTMYASHVH
jgi:hypothetical protein